MAAHEEQDERVVLVRGFPALLRQADGEVASPLPGRGSLPAAARELAAHVVGHAAGGNANEPRPRIVGQALLGPLHGRRDERFLDRVLGGREVPEAPDDGAEDPRREVAQQALGAPVEEEGRHTSVGGPLITWRTSIAMFSGMPPGPGAAEARAAIA
jgi:hypothetical protein